MLHFDIHNTILMKDRNQGINSIQYSAALIIAKSAWGRLTPASETDPNSIPNWHLAYDQLAWNKPEYVQVKDKETGELVQVAVVRYWDFLQEHYPLDDKDAAVAEHNKQIQIDRILSFAKPGGLAAKFKNSQEKMLKALTLPKGAKEELDYPLDFPLKVQRGEALYDDEQAEDDENKLTEEDKLKMDMFGEGKFHLIPSFFRTLVYHKK